jgi:hypothetical protein
MLGETKLTGFPTLGLKALNMHMCLLILQNKDLYVTVLSLIFE